MTQDPILSVRGLQIRFGLRGRTLHAIRDIDLDLYRGEVLALVGESGSGKSVFTKSFMGLLDANGSITGGSIDYYPTPGCAPLHLAALKTEKEWLAVRGREIAMVMQDPMTSLNPCYTVGFQIMEAIKVHQGGNKKTRRQRAIDLLNLVGIPDPASRLDVYPHQLSGGMSQRVMIAMAIACRPKLLIADEPTTALDVTVQAQIMTLLNELKREFNTAIIMITHDLGVVAGICDKVLVMYAGRTMEYGNARDVFYQPAHPYSIGLLNAVPRLDAEGESLLTIPGNPPNLLRLPKGCPFQPRCPHAMEICNSAPPLEAFAPGRLRACFKPQEELV